MRGFSVAEDRGIAGAETSPYPTSIYRAPTEHLLQYRGSANGSRRRHYGVALDFMIDRVGC